MNVRLDSKNLAADAANYQIHSRADCTGSEIGTGIHGT